MNVQNPDLFFLLRLTFILNYAYEGVCAHECRYQWRPEEGVRYPRSWSYKKLWAAWCEWWEPNSRSLQNCSQPLAISPAPLRPSNYGVKLGLAKRPWSLLCFFNTVPGRKKHKEQRSKISHSLLPSGAWETYRHPGPFPGCSELNYPWRQMFNVFGQPGWHAWVSESTLPLNPDLILYPYIQR